MSGFTRIDLSKLEMPQLVETLDFEAIVAEIKADLAERAPEVAAFLELESEPLIKLVEAVAYREMLLRQRVNEAGKAVMLATAGGSDLDNLAALFGVQRLLVDPGDPDAIPPVPATYESDERLRLRAQLSLEAHTTAGSEGSYTFWALSAAPDVRDVNISSPNPGEVLVTVLDENGAPSQVVLDAVDEKLSHENVRPLTDHVTVRGANLIEYEIKATLTLLDGPDNAVVIAAADASVRAYAERQFHLGHDITVSGLHAALHVEGVQNVALTEPITDLDIAPHEAARNVGVTLSFGGRDE